MQISKPVVIIGAGITGCTIAEILSRHNTPVVVIERESSVGGLARTFDYNGFKYDIGPHRFHTHIPQIDAYIRSIIHENLLDIGRESSVFFQDRFFEWPLRPAAIVKLPIRLAVQCALDLLRKNSCVNNGNQESFEYYVINRYGKTLYELFFKQYTEKFSFVPCNRLHHSWASASIERAVIDKRIPMNNLLDVVKMMLMPQAVRTRFIYPAGGNGLFCEIQKDLAEKRGVRFLCGTTPVSLKVENSCIYSVELSSESIEPSMVVWTAPINRLCRLLEMEEPSLRFMNTVVYNLILQKPPIRKDQWIYFSSKDIIFARVSNPSTFDPANIPAGRGGLCVELMCHDPSWWNNPKLLTDRIVNDLMKVRLVQKSDIVDIKIERIAETYPIYTIDYPQIRQKTLTSLCKISNLIPTGRCGAFVYNNMDDSIEMGLHTAERILSSQQGGR